MSYIKLDRKTLEWGWFTDVSTAHLWIYILLNANFKDNEWRGEIYEKGSFPTSLNKIANDTGISIPTIRKGLKKLQKTNEITVISTKQGTKIIVNKWALYQGESDEVSTQGYTQIAHDISYDIADDITHDIIHNVSTLEESKESKEGKEGKEYINAGGRKPFEKPTIEEIKNYCVANGYTDIEAERFFNYYEKNDWMVKGKKGKKKMSNWKLCLNSWVVNEIRFNQTNDLKNKAREAYIKDVERKVAYSEQKKDGGWF
jgi:DNA-binding transcriptional regulator YhcF (GntR family)